MGNVGSGEGSLRKIAILIELESKEVVGRMLGNVSIDEVEDEQTEGSDRTNYHGYSRNDVELPCLGFLGGNYVIVGNRQTIRYFST